MVDAGAPQIPVRSHVSAPPAGISKPTGLEVPQPMSDEPLAEGNDFMSLINRTPLGWLGDVSNPLEAVGPIGGPGRFKQPMPSEGRMGELVKKFGGFQLPDGKLTAVDVNGTNQILEGDQASKMYHQLTKTPTHQVNRESGMIPTVSGSHELSDVSVPIADSLDTAATPKLPISQDLVNGSMQDSLKRKSTTATRDDILKIRELYDSGMPMVQVAEAFSHLNNMVVRDIAKRGSFVNVK
jgi:hypothetical protein